MVMDNGHHDTDYSLRILHPSAAYMIAGPSQAFGSALDARIGVLECDQASRNVTGENRPKRFRNQQVAGSSPAAGSRYFNHF